MADPLSVTSSIVGLVQTFNGALSFLATTKSYPRDSRVLSEVSMYMRVLEYCSGVIQNAQEGPLTQSIMEVATQCAEIGGKITYQTDKAIERKKPGRLAYVIAPREQLAASVKDFAASVSLLHSLVQRSVSLCVAVR